MLEKTKSIFDAFGLDFELLGCVGGGGVGRGEPDGFSVVRVGTLQLVESCEQPEIVPVGDFVGSLSQISQVGAGGPSCDLGLVVEQESLLDGLPVRDGAVLALLGRLPPDDGLFSEEQIELSDLLLVGVPTGDRCGCFEPVDEVGRRDGLLRRDAVVPGEVGGLLDDLVLLKSGVCCCCCCLCGVGHFLFFGASGSVTQIQANLFSSQKNFFAR